ncbi:MAG: MGH1-like glycoside hydrolase domain-containing protein [Marinifilaceae bacterium]
MKIFVYWVTFLSLLIINPISSVAQTDTIHHFDQQKLPAPFSDDYPHFEELYYTAWSIAQKHIQYNAVMPQPLFIDEAFCKINDWIWDTNFMLMYWRYAYHLGPWILTNNNFYGPIHNQEKTAGKIHIPDNPPMFAWTENLYNHMSGDKEHLNTLLLQKQYLQRHFHWFDTITPGQSIAGSAITCLQRNDKGYFWEGGRSGMDNTPRGRTYEAVKEDRPNNPNMLWIDAIAQQALTANQISILYTKLGNKKEANQWQHKHDSIASIINKLYWDSEDGFYYDIDNRDNKKIKVATPASYWVLLAGAASKKQAKLMAQKAASATWFGASIPFTTLRPNDSNYSSDGDYWRGALWLPTAYMSIKALDRYNYRDITHNAAIKIINHQYKTYKEFTPHTIWECYSPTEAKPSFRHDHQSYVRPDFCGWSALGPISLFIENVLGFYDIDAWNNTIKWDKRLTKPHGIRNLHFGDITTDIVWDGKEVIATANKPYTLLVNGKKIKVKVIPANHKQ